MINSNHILKIKDNLIYDKIEQSGMLLYDESKKETHLLNVSATEIFEMIDGKKTIKVLYEEYSNRVEFLDVTLQQVQEDFMDLISTMIERGLLILEK